LGYEENLPAPIAAVQVTLAAMKAPQIHEYIQTKDTESLSSSTEDGEQLLLLTTLDLSQWTRIFEFANNEKTLPTALKRLQEYHVALNALMERDMAEYQEAKYNTQIVEAALKKANN